MPPVDAPRRRLLMATLCAAAAARAPAANATQAPDTGFEWRPWPAGRKTPPLHLTPLDGPTWRLAARQGRPVLLNFWATWCEPCRAELPSLLRLAAQHAEQGLLLMTVNYREPAARIRSFLQAQGLDLPVLLDADGQAAKAWTPRIFPSTVFVRRNGRPAGVLVGEINWQGPRAQALVAPLLKA